MRRRQVHKKKLPRKVWERMLKVQNGISILEKQPKGDTIKKPRIDLSWFDYKEELDELKRRFKIDL